MTFASYGLAVGVALVCAVGVALVLPSWRVR